MHFRSRGQDVADVHSGDRPSGCGVSCPMLRFFPIALAAALALAGCASRQACAAPSPSSPAATANSTPPAPASIEAPPQPVAPDAVADSVLVDVRTVDSTIQVDARYANAEGRVLRYRQILVRAMEAEGFTNYDQEWWHFSYSVEGAVPFDRVIR